MTINIKRGFQLRFAQKKSQTEGARYTRTYVQNMIEFVPSDCNISQVCLRNKLPHISYLKTRLQLLLLQLSAVSFAKSCYSFQHRITQILCGLTFFMLQYITTHIKNAGL